MGKSQDLYKKAKQIIPGGTQLLSKRPEMFMQSGWPAYYDKAKGCEIWDLDGNKYLDTSYMGIGSCILGYSDDDVNDAVRDIINKGNMTTLNSPEEVELTELLLEIHPWAEMARFARTGGEAMAIAVRIARAKTGKDKVLFCGYHGWHDWYLSANLADDKALDGHLLKGLSPNGVPRALKGTSYAFKYNDTKSFLDLIENHKNEVGAVVLESIRSEYPDDNFLKTIRNITNDMGIVLVVDEITAAWRLNIGGAHLLFSLDPDIAVFAKGISNGFPMSAVIGRKNVMDKAQETFISSTYWTDRIGPCAAIATIKKMQRLNVPVHLERIGKKIQNAWIDTAKKHKLNIKTRGIYPLGHFSFEYNEPLVLKTLFTQLMLERGFLASTAFYVSYAHTEEIIEKYINALDESFAVIAEAVLSNNIRKYLKTETCHAGFKRLT
ncbi:aminotransferase class III-fold pyridoxal phosphate-dependent enzyme [bacterium]